MTKIIMMVPPLLHTRTAARHRFHRHSRTFVNARIKWVRDPYLDAAVEREKNLKPLLSLKSLILSNPSQTLPLSAVSSLKPNLHLPAAAEKFIGNYPLIFRTFLPPNISNSLPHVKLTPKALALHYDEVLLLTLSHYRKDVAQRLARLLMLSRARKLPLYLIEAFKFDLGLPHDYLHTLLLEFPDYFQICDMGFRDPNGDFVFGLELVSWRDDLAISEIAKKCSDKGGIGMQIRCSMNFPKGYDLQKRVLEWMDEWLKLPYISPYENAFHLSPNSDQAEKWTVGLIHELLSLLVSKKTERDNLFRLAEFLGFGQVRFKKALVHFPGIFYVSNKLKTQTVVLRDAFSKNVLIEKHPLMVMRNRYISLMNLVLRRGKPIRIMFARKRNGQDVGKRKHDYNRWSRSDDES